jgi:ubiquinone/menaquinone biosynthesis C-methylase UbiE
MAGSGRDAYRRAARRYDQLFGRLNAGLRGLGLKMFPPREGMDVLDVGCGTGLQLVGYQQARCQVSGIDASPAMLAVARRRLGDNAALQLGDATRLPYRDQAFDLVLASTVLHEMSPAARAATLDQMRRVLRPGGRVLLTDFEAGPVRPGRGWITKGIITASEAAAGRTHRRNYRHFIAHGGLPPLLNAQGFSVDQRRIVSGGAIGLYLALPHDTGGTSRPGTGWADTTA